MANTNIYEGNYETSLSVKKAVMTRQCHDVLFIGSFVKQYFDMANPLQCIQMSQTHTLCVWKFWSFICTEYVFDVYYLFRALLYFE